MHFLDILKERMEAVKAAAEEVVQEISDLVVPEEVRLARTEICVTCEHHFPISNQCKKCGCFLAGKTRFAGSVCPVGKWTEHKVIEIKSVPAQTT